MSKTYELPDITLSEELGLQLFDLVETGEYDRAETFIREHLKDLDFSYLEEEYRDDPKMESILERIRTSPPSYEEMAEDIDLELSRGGHSPEEEGRLLNLLKSYLEETLKVTEVTDPTFLASLAARDPRLLEWFLNALGERRSLIDYNRLISVLPEYYNVYHPLVKWLINVAESSNVDINYIDLLYDLVNDEEAFFFVKKKAEENRQVLDDNDYCDLLDQAETGSPVYEWLTEEITNKRIDCQAVYKEMEEDISYL